MTDESQQLRTLVDLRELMSSSLAGRLLSPVAPVIERLLELKELNETYYRIQRDTHTLNFFESCLRSMRIAYSISDEDLEKIPRSGPVVVVSNHPYGGLDGIVLGAMLSSLRDDVRLIANNLLGRILEIRPWLIEVDPYETRASTRANLLPLKAALAHLRDGGLLMSFPSGTVSHFQLKRRRFTDPDWNPNTARLAMKTGATVVPMFVEGLNSWLFQTLGLIHPLVRTLLLPYEMVRRYGTTVSLRVGTPIKPKRLAEFETPEKVTEFLRLSSYILRKRHDEQPRRRISFPAITFKAQRKLQPVVDGLAPELLETQIHSLPPDQHLLEQKQFDVYWASADQALAVVEEIGRLRELTFRAVGEGTGEATDLDRFDLHYRHIFLWDREERCIAGAYRIGAADEILKTHGVRGLYTSTLFNFKPGLLESLGPALEMGRSFIVSNYQRKKASLGILWRGIGTYVAKNPKYAVLFGPVSISREYNAISKDLMVKFLQHNCWDHSLASRVSAKRPPKNSRSAAPEKAAAIELLDDVDEVSALISEVENDKKGLPVLLRHYLKLDARVLAFNVDPEFGNCLDGLIVTDLRKSDRKLLRGYLGEDGLARFLAFHGLLD